MSGGYYRIPVESEDEDGVLQELLTVVREDIADLEDRMGEPLGDDEKRAIAAAAFENVQRGEPINSEAVLIAHNADRALEHAKSGRRDLAADINEDCDQLERERGFTLLRREREAIAEEAIRQARRHDEIDVKAALESHYRDRKEDPPSRDNQQGFMAYLMEKAQEKDPDSDLNRAWEVSNGDRDLDLSDPDDYATYVRMRLEGMSKDDFEPADDDDTDTDTGDEDDSVDWNSMSRERQTEVMVERAREIEEHDVTTTEGRSALFRDRLGQTD